MQLSSPNLYLLHYRFYLSSIPQIYRFRGFCEDKISLKTQNFPFGSGVFRKILLERFYLKQINFGNFLLLIVGVWIRLEHHLNVLLSENKPSISLILLDQIFSQRIHCDSFFELSETIDQTEL